MAAMSGLRFRSRVPGAAVGGDQRGAAPHMLAVVEPEIAGHAGQQHAVGFAQGLATLVAQLQRMVASQQAARHARQIHRDAELCHGARPARRPAPRSTTAWLPITSSGRWALANAAWAARTAPSVAFGASTASIAMRDRQLAALEHLAHMAVQVEAQHPVGRRSCLCRPRRHTTGESRLRRTAGRPGTRRTPARARRSAPRRRLPRRPARGRAPS